MAQNSVWKKRTHFLAEPESLLPDLRGVADLVGVLFGVDLRVIG